MATHSSIFKSLTSLFVAPPTNTTAPDEEQLFLASIAHLSPDEQRQRLQRRALYRRMVQRQGLMEIEHRADQHHPYTG